MFSKMGGWSRLGVALAAAWMLGVSFWALFGWLRLVYGESAGEGPFAVWMTPAEKAKPGPAALVLEWDVAFRGRGVGEPLKNGWVPHFCGSVFLTLLLGPPLAGVVLVLVWRWVRAGFAREDAPTGPPRPALTLAVEDTPPGKPAPASFTSGPHQPARFA